MYGYIVLTTSFIIIFTKKIYAFINLLNNDKWKVKILNSKKTIIVDTDKRYPESVNL